MECHPLFEWSFNRAITVSVLTISTKLFPQRERIEHRTTKVRRPQSNGFVEKLHRTLLDEHFRIMCRTKWYESIEEMQKYLEV